VGGWGGQCAKGGYPSDTMGPVVVPKEPLMISKSHYKAKQAV